MRILRFCGTHFEELAAGTFLVLMSLATFANVVARYFFNNPLEWAEEFSRYSFIWIVFLGAAYCTKSNRRIVIDGLVLALPSRMHAPVFRCWSTCSPWYSWRPSCITAGS